MQHYTPLKEAIFSKSISESLKMWTGKPEYLKDNLTQIRSHIKRLAKILRISEYSRKFTA